MKRSIGSYVVQFGLVSIPATLHTVATENKSKTGLNLLHGGGCGGRLKQQYICPAHDEPVVVEKDQQTKGYEVAKGTYIEVTPQDLETIPLPSKGTIAITSVCNKHEIDPVWFEQSYVLAPGKGGARPFALLAKALDQQGLIALATITVRQKEQLCGLRFAENRLHLHPLFYGEEMQLEGAEVPGLDAVSSQELEMAKMLLTALRKPFDPEEHADGYTAAFTAMIERKVEGKAPEVAPVPQQPKEIDFMAALQASIEAAKKPEGAAAGRKQKKGAAA
jgi:DNA end-binding protein Ku